MTELELQEKYGDERVLVVDSRNFNNETDTIDEYYDKIVKYGRFEHRYRVENNEGFKQIIPYVVLKCGEKYFITRRLGGDERLVGNFSLGQGGHINPVDLVEFNNGACNAEFTVLKCIHRELNEETTLGYDLNVAIHPVGVFVDESNPVSRVHACMLFVAELAEEIQVKETNKLAGGWYTVDEITPEMFNLFESWSKIAYEKIICKVLTVDYEEYVEPDKEPVDVEVKEHEPVVEIKQEKTATKGRKKLHGNN